MRKDITVGAGARQTRGKNEARRLRAQGMIPAVVYGAARDAVAVAVNPREVDRILRSKSGHNTIFNLSIDLNGNSETTPVMVVDWQHDPIKDRLLHVDLKRIDLTKRLVVNVPVHTVGEPKGVKQQGGLLEIVTREVQIECLPDDIPEDFTIDTTELMIGQSKRASEVLLKENMKLMSPPDAVIAHVVALKAEEAPAAEAAPEGAVAAPAEPEVIKKGKKEEEGAEPAKGGEAKGAEAKGGEAKGKKK
jgi:large subunit ribosomal protein L25